jgi:diadenosine tetraphosphate (Ap4A) HIT family hydrolase
MYDSNNIFAKIIRGEIPCDKVFENGHALSFRDIDPVADIHVLVIPRGSYENILDFITNATDQEQAGFWAAVHETAEILGITGNFNAVANAGNAPLIKQSVFHFHLHLTAGNLLKSPSEIIKS